MSTAATVSGTEGLLQMEHAGGAVMTDADVVLIFYGTWDTARAKEMRTILTYFTANLNNSSWYNVNRCVVQAAPLLLLLQLVAPQRQMRLEMLLAT